MSSNLAKSVPNKREEAVVQAGVIAVIPARAGSKRIPRKNLADLAGLPLIAHSIRWALQEPGIERVLVTTDSEEIASVAREHGAEAPFLRPAELAGDTATDLEVFTHLLDWLLEAEAGAPELLVQVRPTTPFRRRGLFRTLLEALEAVRGATHARTIRPAPVPPFKTYWREADGTLGPVSTLAGEPEAHNLPAQRLPRAWIHDGALDLVLPQVVRAGSMTGPRIVGVVNEDPDAIDIDEPMDLALARQIAARRLQLGAREAAARVRLLACDVDGTLTDATAWYDAWGEALKRFSMRDGMGLTRLLRFGVQVAWITQEQSGFPAARAGKLQIPRLLVGVEDKAEALRRLAQELGVPLEAVGFVGDDLNDLPALRLAGFRACPSDAVAAVRGLVHYVAPSRGGRGAVRDVCEFILEARGEPA
jgi:N-acylneuraminate cytidylyltransferase